MQFCLRLGTSAFASVVASLFFVSHPIHTEAVSTPVQIVGDLIFMGERLNVSHIEKRLKVTHMGECIPHWRKVKMYPTWENVSHMGERLNVSHMGECIPHGRKVKMYIGSIFHMGNVSHIEERLKCIPHRREVKMYPIWESVSHTGNVSM